MHGLVRGKCRREYAEQVYMIRLDSQIDYLVAHFLRFFVQENGQSFWNVVNQHFSPVFWNPDKVAAYLVCGMSSSSDHAVILGH